MDRNKHLAWCKSEHWFMSMLATCRKQLPPLAATWPTTLT